MRTLIFAWFLLLNLSVLADDPSTPANNPWTDGYTPEIRQEAVKISDDLTAMLNGGDTSDAALNAIDDRITAYFKKYGPMGGHTENNMEIARGLQLAVLEKVGNEARFLALVRQIAKDPLQPWSNRMIRLVQRLDNPPVIKFTATDGTPVDVSQMTGKLVLIQFWNGVPDGQNRKVLAVYKKYHDQGLESVGLCQDLYPSQSADFAKSGAIPGYVYLPPDPPFATKDPAPIITQYGLDPIDSTWIIGKDGKVLWVQGGDNPDGTTTDDALEKHVINFLKFH